MNLEFANIGHQYGANRALANINLTARSGEITCLLGSSGCGKTTLLNLAAGLLEVQEGTITLDGEVLASANRSPPPEQRPVGLVFQNGALFPHMSIADNILFGVVKADRSADLAEQWLDVIGLGGLGERFPASLSGGQQQRVALARSMAPQPAVLLLDEPFASIDVVLRKSLRREARRLLKARGATAILVTHDPEEAQDIGDTIAVMEAGEILQTGSPQELYTAPASMGVACMFGDNQSVLAKRTDKGLETAFGIWPLAALADSDAPPQQIELYVRENALDIAPDRSGLSVRDVRVMGHVTRVTLANEAGDEITAAIDPATPIDPISRFSACPKPASLIAFPKQA